MTGTNGKPATGRAQRGGFTLMELMVSIGILIIIILGVGVMFGGASQAVSGSQNLMDVMSGVRATQQLMSRDFAGLDKEGFLVIRSRLQNSSTNPSFLPGKTLAELSPHFDQVAFMSYGSFPNRNGADNNAPFTDGTVANAAYVWWGQLALEATNPPDASYLSPPTQGAMTPDGALPTGALLVGGAVIAKETQFMLGRSAILLMPGTRNASSQIASNGRPLMAYDNIARGTANVTGTQEGVQANIASSRYKVAAMTPAQVMQSVVAGNAALHPSSPFLDVANLEANYEAMQLCYRFRALASVYDTEVPANPFVNGYFRTTPQVMQGVSSFKVEWSGGPVGTRFYQNNDADNPGNALTGQVRWFGATKPFGNYNGIAVDKSFGVNGDPTSGDHYVATFSYYNREMWPKALRITMHVANDRLKGGRDFVQVINISE